MNDGSDDEFDRLLDRAVEDAHGAFIGKYRSEIEGLLALSKAEIDAITPDNATDLETYETLMAVVREASRLNASQAQLAGRVRALGDIAVAIAKKVPKLAAIL